MHGPESREQSGLLVDACSTLSLTATGLPLALCRRLLGGADFGRGCIRRDASDQRLGRRYSGVSLAAIRGWLSGRGEFDVNAQSSGLVDFVVSQASHFKVGGYQDRGFATTTMRTPLRDSMSLISPALFIEQERRHVNGNNRLHLAGALFNCFFLNQAENRQRGTWCRGSCLDRCNADTRCHWSRPERV